MLFHNLHTQRGNVDPSWDGPVAVASQLCVIGFLRSHVEGFLWAAVPP